MNLAKKIAAIVAAIIVLLLVVLLARWVGDKIRERFLTPKPVITTNVPVETVPEKQEPVALGSETATISAIPKTGPVEVFYLFSGLAAVSGIVLRKISA